MKIVNLTQGSAVYTSNAYLLTGTWNAIPDVNTLVDTGRDKKLSRPFIIPLPGWVNGGSTR